MCQCLLDTVILNRKEDILFVELFCGMEEAGRIKGGDRDAIFAHHPAVLGVIQGREVNAPVQKIEPTGLEGLLHRTEVAQELLGVIDIERTEHNVDKVHRFLEAKINKVGQVKLDVEVFVFGLLFGKLDHSWAQIQPRVLITPGRELQHMGAVAAGQLQHVVDGNFRVPADSLFHHIHFRGDIPVRKRNFIVLRKPVYGFQVITFSYDEFGGTRPMDQARATFGGGCFWCLEAIFSDLAGVVKVVSGYSGGHVENPSYQQVCTGETGHAEVVQITYDRSIISYKQLLQVFFSTHDPTTLNRQGADVGSQYRSVIFYEDPSERDAAQEVMAAMAELWDDPIVTEVTELQAFYPAEPYHRNYFAQNPEQAYCQMVIAPKVAKFRKQFQDRLRSR